MTAPTAQKIKEKDTPRLLKIALLFAKKFDSFAFEGTGDGSRI